MDRARQPPRRLGVRRLGSAVRPRRHDGRGQGDRRLVKTGWRPEAHPRLRQLGRRGAGAAGLHRMGRDACQPSCRQGGARTSIPTPTAAACSAPAAATRCSTWSTRWRAGVTDPETHVSVRERLRARQLVDGSRKDAKPEAKAIAAIAATGGDVADRRPWLRFRLQRIPRTPWHRLARPGLRRRGRQRRHLPLTLRLVRSLRALR